MKANNFLMIKHYNSFLFTEENYTLFSSCHNYKNACYHRFLSTNITNAFEPFLPYVREYFLKSDLSNEIDAIIDELPIYKLHHSIIKNYILTGCSDREENLLLD